GNSLARWPASLAASEASRRLGQSLAGGQAPRRLGRSLALAGLRKPISLGLALPGSCAPARQAACSAAARRRRDRARGGIGPFLRAQPNCFVAATHELPVNFGDQD